jgi:hypothetical protein
MHLQPIAGMAELADAADSKSAGLRPLGVRFPLPAPKSKSFAGCKPERKKSFPGRYFPKKLQFGRFSYAARFEDLRLFPVVVFGRFSPLRPPVSTAASSSAAVSSPC